MTTGEREMNVQNEERKERYIQIGYTALRDPKTGDFLPAVPLYIKAEGNAAQAEQDLIDDIGNLFARRMKAYMEGCKAAGVAV